MVMGFIATNYISNKGTHRQTAISKLYYNYTPFHFFTIFKIKMPSPTAHAFPRAVPGSISWQSLYDWLFVTLPLVFFHLAGRCLPIFLFCFSYIIQLAHVSQEHRFEDCGFISYIFLLYTLVSSPVVPKS